jgi:hypothetical protein
MQNAAEITPFRTAEDYVCLRVQGHMVLQMSPDLDFWGMQGTLLLPRKLQYRLKSTPSLVMLLIAHFHV